MRPAWAAGGRHRSDKAAWTTPDGRCFVKRTDPREVAFYEAARGGPLAPFMPALVAAAGRELALENLCRGLARPCCADFKLGRRTYGYGFPEERARLRDLKARRSTSWEHCVRLTGYVVAAPDGELRRGQDFGAALSLAGLQEEVRFLRRAVGIDPAAFARQCDALVAALEATPLCTFGASLLVLQDYKRPETLRLRLCDFTYSYYGDARCEGRAEAVAGIRVIAAALADGA